MSLCPYCGWPDDQPVQTLSQHPTGEGMTLWTRCACGSLQLRQLTAGSVRVTVRGQPAHTPPGRTPNGQATAPPAEREGCSGPRRG